MTRIAAIDVGSNSIHMVVAEARPDGQFLVLDRAKEMVLLGRRSLTTGRLTRAAMDHGIRALGTFKSIALRHGVTRFRAVATSAVREAGNGGEFIQRIYDEVGLRVRVISGKDEARLIFLGVSQVMDLGGEPTAILDIGGGSVEVIVVEDGKAVDLHSLKLGVARLTEVFFDSDPPRPRSVVKLVRYAEEQLDEAFSEGPKRKTRRVVVTSGTMTTLASMAAHRLGVHPGTQVHGLEVPAAAIAQLARDLRYADRQERLQMRGMDPKRVELIVAGALVAEAVLARLKARRVQVCTWALREGLLSDYIARHAPGLEESARIVDARRRNVMRLVRRFGSPLAHSERVARISLRLFDQLKGPPALLHDVGHLIDHEDHHRHSYYLIVNSELFGFRREEVEAIGQIALHHHRKGNPKPGDAGSEPLPPETWRQVKPLAAILRLAEGLERSHYGAVRDIRVHERRGRYVVELQTQNDAALEVWEGNRRTELLGKLLQAEVVVRASAVKRGRGARRKERQRAPARPKKKGRRERRPLKSLVR